MASDLLPSSEGINGINLANYFPNRRSYNSVVYFHKRFLPDIKEERTKDIIKDEKSDKGKSKKKKTSNNVKHDKSQQFNSETMNQQSFKYETVETAPYNNSLLDQTVRFAKNLAPLIIPKQSSPVFYTIKTFKKHKKRDKNPPESSIELDATYNKEKAKKTDVFQSRKKRKESSIKESIDPSSQDTLDDIHININQSCSFSESTEVKFHKKVSKNYKFTNESSQKFFVSNSFEALATESVVDGSKIKIHLMNDLDKNKFSESIQTPIVNTIRDYITQLNFNNNKEFNIELKSVQNLAKSNSEKLDDILEKLACIQKNMDSRTEQATKAATPRVSPGGKASKLEEIGQDILEIKDHRTSEDEDFTEEYNKIMKRRKSRCKDVVVELDPNVNSKEDKKKDSLGCGEEVPGPLNTTSSISHLGVKPDRPNRLPARFCWTDADRKK